MDPDIILINSHGMKNENLISIFNYNVHQTNTNNSQKKIAIRKDIKYILHDDFETDLIAITIETRQGNLQ